MKLSTRALAWTSALLWGGAVLLTGILNLVWPKYGVAFLDTLRSLYPGYGATSGFVGVIVGTLYALVVGTICGALVAWLYNRFAKPESAPTA